MTVPRSPIPSTHGCYCLVDEWSGIPGRITNIIAGQTACRQLCWSQAGSIGLRLGPIQRWSGGGTHLSLHNFKFLRNCSTTPAYAGEGGSSSGW